MTMLQEFKAFAVKGNVVDLAIAVIIGAAFSKIVDSLVQDLIMPLIATLFGGLDFTNYYIPLNHQSPTLSLIDAKKAGAVFAYGNFLTISLNFLLLAFVIFQMVRLIQRLRHHEPVVPVVVGPTAEVILLTEIRDSLRPRQP